MATKDDFFHELMALASILHSMENALSGDFSGASLEVVEKAATLVSTRAIEIMHGILEIKAEANKCADCEKAVDTGPAAPSATVPANTSSQPAPADLGTPSTDSTPGAESPVS